MRGKSTTATVRSMHVCSSTVIRSSTASWSAVSDGRREELLPEGRMVSRSIAWNEALGAVSFEADYLFERMIPFLDQAGRISGSPKAVKAQCCPLRDQMTPEIIERCL